MVLPVLPVQHKIVVLVRCKTTRTVGCALSFLAKVLPVSPALAKSAAIHVVGDSGYTLFVVSARELRDATGNFPTPQAEMPVWPGSGVSGNH